MMEKYVYKYLDGSTMVTVVNESGFDIELTHIIRDADGRIFVSQRRTRCFEGKFFAEYRVWPHGSWANPRGFKDYLSMRQWMYEQRR